MSTKLDTAHILNEPHKKRTAASKIFVATNYGQNLIQLDLSNCRYVVCRWDLTTNVIAAFYKPLPYNHHNMHTIQRSNIAYYINLLFESCYISAMVCMSSHNNIVGYLSGVWPFTDFAQTRFICFSLIGQYKEC